MDLYELNEAFAAQSLAVVKELGVDPAKVRTNEGYSGCFLLVRLFCILDTSKLAIIFVLI